MRRARCLFTLAALALPIAAQQDDPILKAMQDEMARSSALKIAGQAQPYFFEYAVHDAESISAVATLGALVRSNRVHFRLPRVQVRVGDYAFDNTNFIGSDRGSGARWEVDEFPIDNSTNALRHHLWLATDMAYKGAIEAYSLKQASLRDVTQKEELADFTRIAPSVKLADVHLDTFNEAPWIARVRRLSGIFTKYPQVTRSSVSFEGGRGAMYLVSSEGSRVRVPEGSFAIRVRATAQAPDGMQLHDAVVFHSLDVNRLPADAELERGTKEVAANLEALVKAPAGEAYTGPVLFEKTAAAQLFADVFGRNLNLTRRPVTPGNRALPITSSELENRIGSRVLPEWMNVVDDPARTDWQGRGLFGHYDVDLEGVPAARVSLVEKGVLKTFLLSRQPVKNFSASNGHGRLPGAFGAKTASIGNLIVEATNSVSESELRKQFLDTCRERNKPYCLVVRKLDFPSSASFEELQRMLTAMAQAGGSTRPVSAPTLVYRVYPDGREELVRGLRFRGLGTRALKDITAASKETYVFDFHDSTAPLAIMGGAAFVSEASVVAPSVILDDVELEREREDLPKPPVVPAPAL